MTSTAVIVGLVVKSGFSAEILVSESDVAVESVNLIVWIVVALDEAGRDGVVVVAMDGAFVLRVVTRCVTLLVTGREVVPFLL